jgi:hypothetical protein
MIAYLKNKATGHWISIFKGPQKSLQQANNGLCFRLPRTLLKLSKQ